MDKTAQDLRRPGVELTSRKQWPTGMAGLGIKVSGKIAAGDQTEPGRALGRLTDIGWGNRLRELVGDSVADGEVPEAVFQACVQVLAAWDWAERPVAVVSMPSSSRPILVRDFAQRIAKIGRLDYLGSLAAASERPRRANSAQRVADLWNRLSLPPELAEAVAGLSGPVLLIDDVTDTGWTMAIAARLLRQAGAPAVLPFALAATS